MYFMAKYDTDLLSKKAYEEKRLVILQLTRKCSGNPQNTASLRLKSRLAEKEYLGDWRSYDINSYVCVLLASVYTKQTLAFLSKHSQNVSKSLQTVSLFWAKRLHFRNGFWKFTFVCVVGYT